MIATSEHVLKLTTLRATYTIALVRDMMQSGLLGTLECDVKIDNFTENMIERTLIFN